LLLIPVPSFADEETAKQSKCLRCHHMTRKMAGPTIPQIAERFTIADVDHLVAEVIRGREGDELTWGKIKMPPSKAPEADVRKVVEWMLAQ
jgi:cytochrome c